MEILPEWARKTTKLELAYLIIECNGECAKLEKQLALSLARAEQAEAERDNLHAQVAELKARDRTIIDKAREVYN